MYRYQNNGVFITSNCKLTLQNYIMDQWIMVQLSIDLWPSNIFIYIYFWEDQDWLTIFSRVIPIKIEVENCENIKTERLHGVDPPDTLRTNGLSDGSTTSSSVIFINELKVKMLIYNFQMGGKSEGNKKMINVPIRMEIKDNDLLSETSKYGKI